MRTPIPQTPKKMSFMHGNFPPIINRTRSDISQGSLGKEEMPRSSLAGLKRGVGTGKQGDKTLRSPAKWSILEVGSGEEKRKAQGGEARASSCCLSDDSETQQGERVVLRCFPGHQGYSSHSSPKTAGCIFASFLLPF